MCLLAPSSCALSYSIFSKWGTQCTNQCTWPDTDGPTGAELGFQQMEYPVIARIVEATLLAQLSQEFCDGSLPVTSPTALLQDGDPFGR